VYFLPGLALVDESHDDVLGRHERQLLLDTVVDDGFVDDQAVGYVVELVID
jgi:hypothetical protein